MTDKLSVDREALMGQVVTEFFERIARGESPRIDEYEERYPEIAEMLGRALPALKHINDSFGGQSTDPEFQLNASQRQLGDFLIVRQIGQGGMGIVYEAQQISLNRRVAIKVLPFASLLREQQLERFRIEARAAASLRHPNIVGVYAVGYERGVHFYAMEFIEGQSLAELMHELKNEMSNVHDDRNSASTDRALKEKPLEKTRPGSGADSTETDRAHKRSTLPDSRSREFYRTAAKLFAKAAQALQHAHELGIVHRDIKPANLLLDKDGKIWITDFGLAQVESDRSLTLSGDLLGTLRYMSPEQASGQNVLDARTDIYSLGVTLYEVLTGCPAFPARDRQSLIAQVIQAAAPPPSKLNQSIPRDLEAVVIKAMSQEPAERYATAGAMAADLQRFADGLPTLAKQPSMLKRGTHWMRRNPLPVAITLLVLLAIGLSSSVANVLLKRAVDRANEQTERAEKAEAELKVAADQSQQDADQARQAAETTAGINRFLTDYVFMRADPASSGSESGNSFRRMLDDATEYADRWFPESPALRSALYFTIGELYSRHGQFDQAVDLYRRSLGLMQRGVILGAGVTKLDAQLGLARALRMKSSFEEAEQLLRGCLMDATGDADEVVMRRASIQLALAELLHDAGRSEEALNLATQSHETRRRLLGEDHADTAAALSQLLKNRVAQGDVVDVKSQLEPAIAVLREDLGIENRQTQAAIELLTDLLVKEGDLTQARAMVDEVYQARSRTLGAAHSLTRMAGVRVAEILELKNQLAEAEFLLKELFQVREQFAADDQAGKGLLTQNLSRVLWKQGKLSEAAAIIRRIPFFGTANETGSDEDFAASLIYGDSLLGLGEFEQAESFLRETWQRASRELGPGHAVAARALSGLCLALFAERKPIESDKLARENLGILLPLDPGNSWVAEHLAVLTVLSRRPNPLVEELLGTSLDFRRRELPAGHLATALTEAIYGEFLMQFGQLDVARELLEKSLAARQAALDDGHSLIAESHRLLGSCLLQLGELDDADNHLMAAQQIAESSSMTPLHKVDLLEPVAQLFQEQGRPDKQKATCNEMAGLLKGILLEWRKSIRPSDEYYLAYAKRYGQALIGMEQFRSAKDVLLEVAALETDVDASSTTYASLAQLFQQVSQTAEADLCRRIVDTTPGPNEFPSSEYLSAITELWQGIGSHEINSRFEARVVRALVELGDCHLRSVDAKNSVDWYQRAVERATSAAQHFPDSMELADLQRTSLWSLGEALNDVEQYAAALESFYLADKKSETIQSSDPDLQNTYTYRGMQVLASLVYLLANCPDSSVRDEQLALEIFQRFTKEPPSREMLTAAGLAYLNSGKPDEVLALLANSENVGGSPWWVLAMAHHARGDEQAALLHYEQALARYQNFLVMGVNNWRLMRQLDKLFWQASHYLQIPDERREAMVAYYKGLSLMQRAKVDQAIHSFESAIEHDAQYAEPYLGLCQAMQKKAWDDQGNHDIPKKAYAAITRYFELKPDKTPDFAYSMLGSLAGMNGDLDTAAQALRKSIDLIGDNNPVRRGWSHHDLSVALRQQEHYAEALDAIEEAVRLLPDEGVPRAGLAWVLAMSMNEEIADFDRALTESLLATEQSPNESVVWDTLGLVYLRGSQYDKAVEALLRNQQSADEGDRLVSSMLLAVCYKKLGRHAMADERLTTARRKLQSMRERGEWIDPEVLRLWTEANGSIATSIQEVGNLDTPNLSTQE